MILKYGRTSFDIFIKNGEILSINSFTKPLELNEIIESFRNPIMMEELEEVVINSRETLIILPDITRKSGAEKFLPYLINLYEKYNKEFKFIYATGTHRKLTEQEKSEILTEEIYRKYNDKIIDHDCDNMDEHFYFGKTRYNTPILINNAYLKADTIIPIGAVSYHYFAGFGGGRKLIIPGIASRKTALNNHKLVLDAEKKIKNPNATTANLKTNPVHNDIVEAVMIARRNKTFFAINTILDDSNNIIDIICGDLFMSHIEACNRLMEKTTITVNKKYKNVVVSAGGFPKDINMVQAQKSIDRITPIVEEGGNIFFFAECIDGYGNKYFEDFFEIKTSTEMFESLLTDYQINRQTAYNLKRITENYRCYLYSNFSKEDTERMGFIKLNTPEEILDYIGDDIAAVVPSSYSFYFKVI